jgi:hypothetical protein
MIPVSLCTEFLQKETFSSETIFISLLLTKQNGGSLCCNICTHNGDVPGVQSAG